MEYTLVSRPNAQITDDQITSLLTRVFVDGGYTDPVKAAQTFQFEALSKRGDLLLAVSGTTLLGVVVCATATSPAPQVAESDEAEMHLLAVDPRWRGNGVGSSLVTAFEQRANAIALFKLVLSTQPTMIAAHRIYERHGYKRNPGRDWSRGNRMFLVYEKTLNAKTWPITLRNASAARRGDVSA